MQEMQETEVQSLGWEDPPEEEMAIHTAILVWKIPWTEEPSVLQSMGSHRTGHDWVSMKESYMHMKTCWHQAKFQLTSMQILIHLFWMNCLEKSFLLHFIFIIIEWGNPNITKHEARMERIDSFTYKNQMISHNNTINNLKTNLKIHTYDQNS